MKSDEYAYVIGKLAVTLEILAVHPGDARERLRSAWYTFHVLQSEDFPLCLQEKWAAVVYGISRFGSQYNDFNGEVFRGSVEHTLLRIRKSTASLICKSIFDIYKEMLDKEKFISY
ncbi:MAG: hypothetical protein ACTHOH_12025 [Lysobacteraceae bacterium]